MRIIYGNENNNLDITNYCINNLLENNKIYIPPTEKIRNILFSDPCPNLSKKIFVQNNDNSIFIDCDNDKELNIHIKNSDNIYNIHKQLSINYGSFNDELPEQRLSYNFLTGNEKVLEIGGNIGRNSLVIAKLLNDSKNLVVLESDKENAKKLNENKELNNFNFHIEDKALSSKKLIQAGWKSEISDILKNGYFWVDICNYNYIIDKYNIIFDTLIIDCEGAFYYILNDFPEILNNINLIIMENDYEDINYYNYVNNTLITNNFKCVYIECLPQATKFPCVNRFFEVWKKNINQNSLDIYVSSNL